MDIGDGMANVILRIYRKYRLRRELSNQFESVALRDYFYENFDIDVGFYSYGCFDPERIPRGTRVGRYCSFSATCWFLNGNHGLSYLSLHPYLYNPSLRVVAHETISRTRFVVEDDVWIGHNATILPSAQRIGRGAVIAAGAVVTRDVERYEIVGGIPASTIRFRFGEKVVQEIEATEWWLWSKCELERRIRETPSMVYFPERFFNHAL